ncbi:peptidase, m48 family [hydrocarbon metagenome]|uniref:Peptidase, m48 family n=1 Tax=hydrocarbon metagenome TaxID=938273 RepID=A0A0W8FSL5_9ZZZZ
MNKLSHYAILLALAALTGCAAVETVATIATDVGVQSGAITKAQGESIRKSTQAVSKSMEDFTPEQEYYIGRSVGAIVLGKYSALSDAKVNAYLNLLGQTLAMASDMPELFGGYHFLVLNSDDINAFATPGGHIFVTRGLIRCCKTEDALAAVLAHEIGHVQLRHGMKAIEKGRVTEALTVLAQESAKSFGSEDVLKLTKEFGGAISDITNTMINNGYSRAYEYDADAASVTILKRIGYNPAALADMLNVMAKQMKPGGNDFAKTHPLPQSRIAELKNSGIALTSIEPPAERKERFTKAVGHLL